MGIMHRTLKMDAPLSTSSEKPDASQPEAPSPLSVPSDTLPPYNVEAELLARRMASGFRERRSSWRLLLDSLGLQAIHPDRSNAK